SGVLDDLVPSAVVGVFVRERVEAMGAARDDLRDPGAVQGLDVGLRQRLEEVLVAHPASGIARASLAGSEDRELDTGRGEQPRDALRRLLGPFVEGTRASHPEQDLGWRIARLQDADSLEGGGPVRASARRLAPRVLVRLD